MAQYSIDRQVMRRRREALGLSQDELGRRIGLSGQAVQAQENGRSDYLMANFLRACQVLDIDPGTLMRAALNEASTDSEPELRRQQSLLSTLTREGLLAGGSTPPAQPQAGTLRRALSADDAHALRVASNQYMARQQLNTPLLAAQLGILTPTLQSFLDGDDGALDAADLDRLRQAVTEPARLQRDAAGTVAVLQAELGRLRGEVERLERANGNRK